METPPKWLTQGYTALFALLPWSVDLSFGAWHLSLPSQPLIALLGIGLALVFWQNPRALRELFSNNIFIQISLAYMVWMAASACFSTIPIVSWKYMIVAVGHWWVFAVGISVWPSLWQRALPWFAFSMVGVAVYALGHHAFHHFRTDQALLAPKPFFPDHTMWAAAVAIVLFGIPIGPPPPIPPKSRWAQWYRFAQYFILTLALVFSTCRAAWASVLLAGGVGTFLVFGTKVRWVLCLGLVLFGFWGVPKITRHLSQDVSSLERVNRWSCALRMAQERPVLGFGPGTFQFQYLDFQRSEEMTRISVREAYDHGVPHPNGRGGGVHSEYLRALSESGWPGLLLGLGLLGTVFWNGFKPQNRRTGKQENVKLRIAPAWWLALALLTFLVHGLANDFFHDDRIAALVWGCMAVLSTRRKAALDALQE